jgi:ATP-dependent helicase/nuclease subunit B
MSGRINLTYSSNWNLLANSTWRDLQPADPIGYSWIYITPNHDRANYLKEKYIKSSSTKVQVTPGFYSWNQFIGKIYDNLPESKQLLNFSDQLFLIHQVLQNNRSKLNYFAPTDRPFSPQIIRSLQSLINAISMIKFSGTQDLLGTNDPFYKEIELIIEEYQKCKENSFLDEIDLIDLIIKDFDEKRINLIFPGVKDFFWEADKPLYPLQIKFIERIKLLGWNIHFQMFYDDHPDFFKNMDGTFQQIKKIADSIQKIDDPIELTQSIYRLDQADNEKLKLDKKLALVKYPDRIKETEEVARGIKKVLIDTDINPNRIAITAPDISQYLPLIISSFLRHGVPFTVSNSLQLLHLLPIQHLQLLLEFLSENGELSILKKILKSPFYNYFENTKGIPFEEILNSLRAQFDFEIILNQLQKSIEYDKGISSENERIKKEVANKKVLLEVLKNIRTDIEPLTKTFSADDFFNFFISLFDQHDMVNKILKWRENLPQKNVADILGTIRTFITGLDIWRSLVTKISNEKIFNNSQTLNLFRLITNNHFHKAYEPHEFGVQILPIQFAEFGSPEKLYVLGLTDSNFPRTNRHTFKNLPDPIDQFFSDNQLLEDRRLFLKLLQIPEKEICISYPEREGDTANVPSNLVLELERITKWEIIEPEPAAVFSKSDVFSKLEYNRESKSPSNGNFPFAFFTETELTHFNRQLKITRLRNSLDIPFGIYEGDISSDKISVQFLKDLFESKEFSVSALDSYANSPIQYFFRKILYIDEPEVFEDWLTPIEKGKMVHRVLYRFYSENRKEQSSLENLLKIAEQEIQKFPFLPSILWDLQKEVFLGGENKIGLFPAFFEYEAKQSQSTPLEPRNFEVPFGHFGKRIADKLSIGFEEPYEIRVDGDCLKLRGIVDRVEMTENGGIVIVDYKTGDYKSVKDIYNGKSLQLPLYLMAISSLLKKGNLTLYPLGACYYQIKDEKEIKKEILFSEPKFPEDTINSKIVFPTTKLGSGLEEITLDGFLERSRVFAVKYSNSIRQGKFMHHNNISDCKSWSSPVCPFEPLCRVNQSKLKQFNSQEEE